jgi:hypothetical protein
MKWKSAAWSFPNRQHGRSRGAPFQRVPTRQSQLHGRRDGQRRFWLFPHEFFPLQIAHAKSNGLGKRQGISYRRSPPQQLPKWRASDVCGVKGCFHTRSLDSLNFANKKPHIQNARNKLCSYLTRAHPAAPTEIQVAEDGLVAMLASCVALGAEQRLGSQQVLSKSSM